METMNGAENTIHADWWLAEFDRDPVGPVNAELLLEWIRAGQVASDAHVCEVGGREWRWIGATPPFRDAVPVLPARFDRSAENCVLDLEPLPSEEPMGLARERFDSSSEVTSVAVPHPSEERLPRTRG